MPLKGCNLDWPDRDLFHIRLSSFPSFPNIEAMRGCPTILFFEISTSTSSSFTLIPKTHTHWNCATDPMLRIKLIQFFDVHCPTPNQNASVSTVLSPVQIFRQCSKAMTELFFVDTNFFNKKMANCSIPAVLRIRHFQRNRQRLISGELLETLEEFPRFHEFLQATKGR